MKTDGLPQRRQFQFEILQEDLNRRVQGLAPEYRSWLGPLHPCPRAPRRSESCPRCHGQGSILHEKDPSLMWQLTLTMVCSECQGRGWK